MCAVANFRRSKVGQSDDPNIPPILTTNTVMERDRRLTGSLRGQSDSPTAPPGFELSSEWKVGLGTSGLVDRVMLMDCCSLRNASIRKNLGMIGLGSVLSMKIYAVFSIPRAIR
jgi:hypothetical protein